MHLKLLPCDSINGLCQAPASKPETQRAVLVASLSAGTSHIENDLRCLETAAMKRACRQIGARIIENETSLNITGIGDNWQYDQRVIQAQSSGLVFRIFTALTSVIPIPVVLSGDHILCQRVMQPLFTALHELGADIESILTNGKAPVVNWGSTLQGGLCHLPGDVSSQFMTAIMFAAPYAQTQTTIQIKKPILSQSYLDQTLFYLRASKITVEQSDDMQQITVEPGQYQAADFSITADYTSVSYILVAAALRPTELTLFNIDENSLQGEKAIIDFVRAVGVTLHFDQPTKSLKISNNQNKLSGNYEFDVSNCPNILPTLAALATYIEGEVKIIGGSITRLHKTNRIAAMATELKKLGVKVNILYQGEQMDGLHIQGKPNYQGDVTFDYWGDHRVFMSLFLVGLATKKPCYYAGYKEVICSFPDFLKTFQALGITTAETSETISEPQLELVQQ